MHRNAQALYLELGNTYGVQNSYGYQALTLRASGRLEEAMALFTMKEAICVELANKESAEAIYLALDDKPAVERCDSFHADVLLKCGSLNDALTLLQKQEAIIARLKCDGANYQATISELKEAMETMVARFNDQDSKIQKVRAKIAIPSPSGRTAGRIRRGGPAPELVVPNP